MAFPPLTKYKNILFDLDGTLVDTGKGIINSVYFCIKEKGLKNISLDEAKLFVGPPLVDSFMKVFKMDYENAVECTRSFRAYYAEKGKFECVLYPNVRNTLEKLVKDGFSLYIATSKPTVFAKEILDRFKIEHLFKDIIGSNLDNSLSKKNEIISFLIEKHKLEKMHTIMIGDKANDIFGARKAGIDSIGVLYGYGSIEEVSSASPLATISEIAILAIN